MLKQFLALVCLFGIQQCAFASEEGDWLKSLDGAVDGAAPARLAARSSGEQAEPVGADLDVTDADLAHPGLTAITLRTRGEHALKAGNYKNAVKLLERTLELTPYDTDARLLYAQALKLQIDKTHSTDPVLYNQCVKQYFRVFKSSDFLEDSKVAERHLEELTGHRPRLFSTPNGYLRSVLKPELETSESVSGELIEPQQVP